MSVHRFLSKREKHGPSHLGRHHHDKDKDKDKVIAAAYFAYCVFECQWPVASAEVTLLPASCVSVTAILLRPCHRPTLGPLLLPTVPFYSHAHSGLTWVPHSLYRTMFNLRSIRILRPIFTDFSMEETSSSMKLRSRRYSEQST